MPDGKSVLMLVAVACLISALLSEGLRRLCLFWGVLDRPAPDRWHSVARPHLGGVAIVAALTISAGFLAGDPLGRSAGCLLAGSAFVFTWGLIDDLRPLRMTTKLMLLAGAGLIPPAFGLGFRAPGPLLGPLLTVVWVAGITNAVNLLDNMDGIAAGVTATAGLTLFGFAVASGNGAGAAAALVLAGAAAGFLVVNFPPARIFMGDCGSMTLGYWLAVTALLTGGANAAPFPVPILIAGFALGVPVLDTTLVVVLRWLQGRSIATGGRDHLTHGLAAWGFSEREVAVILYLLTASMGFVAATIMASTGGTRVAAVVFGIGLLGSVGAASALAHLRRDALPDVRVRAVSREI